MAKGKKNKTSHKVQKPMSGADLLAAVEKQKKKTGK